GDAADGGERERRRAARPVERDLENVLMDLAESFPLLAALVEQRAGDQRRLPSAKSPEPGDALVPGVDWASHAVASESLPAESAPPPDATTEPLAGELPHEGDPRVPNPPSERSEGREPTPVSVPGSGEAHLPGKRGPRRPGRYGLNIQFEALPGDPELARLVESTVWINESHPAYRRAVASRSEGYHIALASALALAPLAVEPAKEHAFVTAFLESWGSTLDRRRPGARGRPRR
ncbi:MAG TPA: hypothetical protein VMS64_38730, partial [Candidatus Methylomirabilis sp.]|nr:hypothetical protein [Candidatus Methylomirabilis sp.]